LIQQLNPTFLHATLKVHCADKQIIEDLNNGATVIHCDNQSALKCAKNPVYHAQTKHIGIQHHFVREQVTTSEIQVQFIPTKDQPADMLTKPLPRVKFEEHKISLGLHSLSRL
jgi:hypothetical protein